MKKKINNYWIKAGCPQQLTPTKRKLDQVKEKIYRQRKL